MQQISVVDIFLNSLKSPDSKVLKAWSIDFIMIKLSE